MGIVEFIAKWEGFRSNAYQDVVGVWTIGYGFTKYDGSSIKQGQYMSREFADEELLRQLQNYRTFAKYVKVPLTESQETALWSFEFNLGSGIRVKNAMPIIDAVNRGDFLTASQILMRYVYAGGKKIQGLVNRRTDEAALLLTTGEPISQSLGFYESIYKTEDADAPSVFKDVDGAIQRIAKLDPEIAIKELTYLVGSLVSRLSNKEVQTADLLCPHLEEMEKSDLTDNGEVIEPIDGVIYYTFLNKTDDLKRNVFEVTANNIFTYVQNNLFDGKIRFERTNDPNAQIKILFGNEPKPFKPTSMAYAYFPRSDRKGEIYMNDKKVNYDKQPLIKQLTHEVMHSLGFRHSDDPTDITFWAYNEDQRIKFSAQTKRNAHFRYRKYL